VLFGSDYPHPEGLAAPLDYLETLRSEHLDDATIRQVMSTNGNALLNLPAAPDRKGGPSVTPVPQNAERCLPPSTSIQFPVR
jgi:hypothetical protein